MLPADVLKVRTRDRDGYAALQLGFADKKRKSATQAERGHARKVDAEPKRYVREIRQESAADIADVDRGSDPARSRSSPRSSGVDVTGTSKGAGLRAS